MKKAHFVYIALLLIFTFLIFYSSTYYRDNYALKYPEPKDAVPKSEFMLDINTATEEQLQEIPGIGPVLAGNIVAYRNEKGPFNRLDELLNVKGIGPKKLDVIRDYVRIG